MEAINLQRSFGFQSKACANLPKPDCCLTAFASPRLEGKLQASKAQVGQVDCRRLEALVPQKRLMASWTDQADRHRRRSGRRRPKEAIPRLMG